MRQIPIAPFWCMCSVLYLSTSFLERAVVTGFMRMHEFLHINHTLSLSVFLFSASKAISACALNMNIRQNGIQAGAVVKDEMIYCNVSLISSVLQCLHGDEANMDWCGVHLKIKEWSSLRQCSKRDGGVCTGGEDSAVSLSWTGLQPPAANYHIETMLHCFTPLSTNCWDLNTTSDTSRRWRWEYLEENKPWNTSTCSTFSFFCLFLLCFWT